MKTGHFYFKRKSSLRHQRGGAMTGIVIIIGVGGCDVAVHFTGPAVAQPSVRKI